MLLGLSLGFAGTGGGLQAGDVHSLVDMQLPGFAVGSQAAKVINAVGGIGVLLDLGDQDTLADGVQGTRCLLYTSRCV